MLKLNPVTTRAQALLAGRAHHVLVCGKTGMGKSSLLREICLAEAERGGGLLLVDPHGDLAAEIQDALPRKRRNDIAPFFASEPESCPGLNPLRAMSEGAPGLVTSNVLSVFRRLWPESWGPRSEHLLRHAILALTHVRGATLEDVRLMLVDDAHRRWVLKHSQEPAPAFFWTREFPSYDKRLWSEITAPILNKLGNLLSVDAVRTIVTKTRRRLDAANIMDRGKIVLASVPKGEIGWDGALFLGALVLGEFAKAAFARASTPTDRRRPFLLVVDEAASFATAPFLELTAEARKYGISLFVATQSLAAMDEHTRHAFLGTVGTLAAFRLGADDAEIVAREFGHEYAAPHLLRLSVGDMVVRTGAGRARLVEGSAP